MYGEDCSIKFFFFAAIVFLPDLCLCGSQSCDRYKTNSTKIQGPPVMTELKTTKIVFKVWSTGEFGSLQCCVSGNPVSKVIWYKNSRGIDLNNYRLKLVDNNQTLWIKDLRTVDSGIYSCEASNAWGNQSRSFKLKVQSKLQFQKPVVMLQPNSWSVFIGSNVTLDCIIQKSAKKPFIDWIHKKNSSISLIRNNDRHLIATEEEVEEETWSSNLTITNVTMDDEGTYTCMARNGAGSGKPAEYSGILTVKELEPEINRPKSGKELKPTWMKEGPFLTGSVFSGLALFLVVIGVIVWRNKRRTHRRSPGYILDDRDQQIDPTPEHSVLIKHEGPMHFEIPHENLQLLRCPADDSNLDFDVFVSYSSLDRDFVKTVLYAELSTTHSVCIDFKDFEAGLYIGDNIFNSIFRSRKTLLVVTRNFLKGVWTFFEMQIAQGRLAQGHDVLIPVIVDDIPFDELPKPLQHYRQTKTYLEYFNEDVKPHFWDRLRSALGPSLRELKENAPTTPEEDSAVRDFV